jgi:hypothetical protein
MRKKLQGLAKAWVFQRTPDTRRRISGDRKFGSKRCGEPGVHARAHKPTDNSEISTSTHVKRNHSTHQKKQPKIQGNTATAHTKKHREN